MESRLKTTLAQCGFTFKKKFGQNFISDNNLLSAIAEEAGVDGICVVEIGCGAGTLTRALSSRAKKVYGYEIDKSLKPVLEKTLSDCANTEVIFRDFLKEDLSSLESRTGEYKVVANLPYYITTPLIMKLVEGSKKCLSLTVMVQEEVAERLCAEPNTPEYGAICAQIALRASCRIVRRVPRTAFTPRPNVDSAVVNITFSDGRIKVNDPAVYKKVVQAAFLSRRKTFENNLMSAFGFPREKAQKILLDCGIDPKTRGEALPPETYAKIADIISENSNPPEGI